MEKDLKGFLDYYQNNPKLKIGEILIKVLNIEVLQIYDSEKIYFTLQDELNVNMLQDTKERIESLLKCLKKLIREKKLIVAESELKYFFGDGSIMADAMMPLTEPKHMMRFNVENGDWEILCSPIKQLNNI